MAWSQVQTLNGGETTTSGATLTASFGSNVTAGNRILLFTAHYENPATNIATPTSSPSLTWTKLVEATLVNGSDNVWVAVWSAVVAATGSLSISAVNTSGSGHELGWTAGEFSGLDASAGTGCVDVSATGTGHNNTGASTSVATGTTAATTADQQLAVAVYGDWGAALTLTAPAGFTKQAGLSRDAAADAGQCVATKTSTVGSTEGGNFTYASTSLDNNALVVVLKLAAGGPTPSAPVSRPQGPRFRRRPAKGLLAAAVPPPVAAAPVAIVTQGRRWPTATRASSDWTSGNKTTVVRGNSQWIQPPAIPGGAAPRITIARRRPPPKRLQSRRVVPPAPAAAGPFTVTTSTNAGAYQRPANDKVVVLWDGSLVIADYDGSTGHVYQVTNPSTNPVVTSLQTFTEDNLSLCVLNGASSSDLWVLSTGDLVGGATAHVRHALYSGGTFTWDASTLVANTIQANTNDCSIVWTGTWLIAMWWDGVGSSSNDQIAYSWTTVKAGTSGWSAAAKFDPTGTSTTVWQVNLRYSAKLAATVAVYGGNSKMHYSILKDSAASPARANWTTMADLDAGFDDTLIQFGGPSVVIDEATGKIHVARAVCNAGGPTWFGVTYWLGTPDATPMVTPSISWSSRLIIDSAGSASSPSDIAAGLDNSGKLWVFWTDALSAGNLKYATLVSPYTSASSATTFVSTGTPRYPHVPSSVLSYIPLVYQTGTASPWSIKLDTSLSASAGAPPVVVSGQRRRNLTRSSSRLLVAALYNSGGITPTRSQGVRRLNLSRPSARLATPVYNSGGLLPRRLAALRRLPPNRASSRLVVPLPSTAIITPTTPVVVSGARRRNLSRSGSHLQLAAPYNSGGLAPLLLAAARQRPPNRPASDWGQGFPLAVLRGGAQTVQPAYNSGGLAPRLIQGVRRRNLSRPGSQLRTAPLYNSSGLSPVLTRGLLRRPIPRSQSRLVVPPPVTVVVTPTTPILVRGFRRLNLSRAASRLFVRVTPVLGVAPQIVLARRRGAPKRSQSRLVVPGISTAPGIAPFLFQEPQGRRQSRPIQLRARSRCLPAPFYNSGGITPLRTQGVRRKPGPPKLSRWLPAPAYNSGGIAPSRTQGVRRINRHRPGSRIKLQAPYNSGGLKPLLVRGVPRKPPTRPRSQLPLTGLLDIGLSRDITLELGQPLSRWQMGRPSGRWQSGSSQGRWLIKGGGSRWQAGGLDERWKNKPPGT